MRITKDTLIGDILDVYKRQALSGSLEGLVTGRLVILIGMMKDKDVRHAISKTLSLIHIY